MVDCWDPKTPSVLLKKNETNSLGISIGGGGPYCPCVFIIQIYDNSSASIDGTLHPGDELLGVNNISFTDKTKFEVADIFRDVSNEMKIYYKPLSIDSDDGESLDIILKKFKHRIIDNISSDTADALGLSRAIICNNSLVSHLNELENSEQMYKDLVYHVNRVIKAYYQLLEILKAFGNEFTEMCFREIHPKVAESFKLFGELHRGMENDGNKMLNEITPILAELNTHLSIAIPDTKLTVSRYTDAKLLFLSYCLKDKEMRDEEYYFEKVFNEPIYRVLTGNFQYRLTLRYRQESGIKFDKLRNDVLEKIELLECKNARGLTIQLRKLIEKMEVLCSQTAERLEQVSHIFPITMD